MNTFGANGLVSRGTTTSGSTFYQFDPMGNVANYNNVDGGTSRIGFDAFGAAQAGMPSGEVFGFQSQWGGFTDSWTGFVLMTNRYYDPQNGRWLTRDPIGYAGGINLYAYCQNNPVNFADPWGLCRQGRDGGDSSGLPFGFDWRHPDQVSDTSADDWSQWHTVQEYGFRNWLFGRLGGPLVGLGSAVTATANLGGGAASALAGTAEDAALSAGGDAEAQATVGRWMSQSEYDSMLSTGKVGPAYGNEARVIYPSDPGAYSAAPPGSLYVEFKVPASVLKPGGTESWRIIPGPNSVYGRLAASKGLPVPEYLGVSDAVVILTK